MRDDAFRQLTALLYSKREMEMTNFYNILRATRDMTLPKGEPFNLGGEDHGLEWELPDGTTVSLYRNGEVQIGDGNFDTMEFTETLLILLGVAKAKQNQLAERGEEKLGVQ